MHDRKRIRYTSTIVRGTDLTEHEFSGDYTTVLNICNNTTTQHVRNCPILSTMHARSTVIQTIDNCPSLYHLSMTNTASINSIKVPSLMIAHLDNCKNLRIVEGEALHELKLNKLPAIQRIHAPSVQTAKLSNMDISNLPFRLSDGLPAVSALSFKYCKIFNLFEEIQRCSMLQRLTLKNCSIEAIDCIGNLQELSITNCSGLRAVCNLSSIKTVRIMMCKHLTRLCQADSIDTMFIDQCDDFSLIMDVSCIKLIVRHCFNLAVLPFMHAKKLVMDMCVSLSVLQIHPDMEVVVVNNCPALDSVEFFQDAEDVYTNLKMHLIGDVDIDHVSDWTVGCLTVENNFTLNTISNVHNLFRLDIDNCIDLDTIENIHVQELSVRNCHGLTAISNIQGLTDLFVSECLMLENIQLDAVVPSKIYINGCENLFFRFDAALVEYLDINNCGIIVASNLNKDAILHVDNAALLPDVDSIDIESFVEATRYVEYAMDVVYGFIMRCMIRSRMRKFIQFKRLGRLSGCVICQDSLSPDTTTFTNCNHMFHIECLRSWMHIRRTCPLCNQAI